MSVGAVHPSTLGWSGEWMSDWDNNPNRGFQGTLDGGNYTITSVSNQQGGLFYVLRNATIKNVTIKSGWYSGGNYTTVLAYAMFNTKIENVVVDINGGSSTNGQGVFAQGRVDSCSFKDVTVKTTNGSTSHVSLFGACFFGKQDHANACTFENFVIEGFTVQKLGTNPHITSGTTYTFIVEGQEKVDDTYIVVPGISYATVEEA